jgi:hypothetical protein
MARQGYGNAQFEVNTEEGLDLVEEFYTEELSKLSNSLLVRDPRLYLSSIKMMDLYRICRKGCRGV